MPYAAPILVQTRSDTGTDWRRFVAVLCFIEFYSEFVCAGHSLHWTWTMSWMWSFAPAERWCETVEYSLRVLRAGAMFGLGRALWRNLPTDWRWLLWCVGFSLIWAAAVGVRATIASRPEAYWILAPYVPVTSRPLIVLMDSSLQLPWLVVLIAYVAASRVFNSRLQAVNMWVVVAASWCIAHQVAALAEVYNPIRALQYWPRGLAFPLGRPLLVAIACLIPSLVGICLLFVPGLAKLLALCTAGSVLTILLGSSVSFFGELWSSAQTLYLSAPHELPTHPTAWTFFLLNSSAFDSYFVSSVRYVGPWLLIAYYAWRVPMRQLPDDGSPFPRRFCGRCLYNLHGLTSDRCPECGASLLASDVAVRQPSRQE